MDSSQIETPHHAIVFTNKDLWGGDLNFVVGGARGDLGTVISLKRVLESIRNPKLRDETFKTEIAHEVGHVYNLPSGRRGKDNLDYETVRGAGGHCKSPGCCMKQGNAVPADFIRITQDRLTHLGENHFYCRECQLDLQTKFARSEEVSSIEAKSFAEILQTTKEKIEAGEPVEIHLDKEGFLSVIENMLSSVPLPEAVKSIKLLKDPEPVVEIVNREGKGNIKIEIDAGFSLFNPKPSLSFTLINAPNNQLQFGQLISDPETIGEHNVAEQLRQQPLHQYLQKAIQNQLDQQNANIVIESVGLQFTEDNKLAVAIRGKKRES